MFQLYFLPHINNKMQYIAKIEIVILSSQSKTPEIGGNFLYS